MNTWLLWAAWLLAACVVLLAQPAARAAGAEPSAVQGTDRQADHTTAHGAGSELLAIERRLRARPAEAADALRAAAGLAPAGSGLQVEMLLARAVLRSRAHDLAAVEQLAQALEGLDHATARAAALAVRAEWQRQHGSLGRAARLLAEGLAQLPATAPASLRVRLLRIQGRSLEGLGQLEEAVRVQQQALKLAGHSAPDWVKSEMHAALAYTYHLAEQPERAWALNAEALRLATAAADELALSGAMTTQGILLSVLGRPAEELQAMQAAITHAQRAGARREEALGVANLADFYLKRQDYAQALSLARQALPLAREVREPIVESVALTNAGLALIALGDREQGTGLVQQSLMLEERAGAITAMSMIQLELGLTLERAGHLPQAWAALMEHRRLAAEVFQREHQQAMAELQEGFDHETRQRELAMLKAENALKEAQLEGRQLQQQLSAGAAAAALLLLGVVVVLLRRMRHSNHALRASNALLLVASERDPLTGLANRRHFQAVMQRETQAGADSAAGALEGSLLLIDVDHFKRINDTHGHALGDAVLVEIAARLQSTLREDKDLTVRWGGEEFLVYARGLPPEQVEVLAERLLAAIGSTPVKHGRERIAVTASIGFATFPLLPECRPIDWERAVDLVDKAMYLAKAHGRNRAYGVRALTAEPPPPWRRPRRAGKRLAQRPCRPESRGRPGDASPGCAGRARSRAGCPDHPTLNAHGCPHLSSPAVGARPVARPAAAAAAVRALAGRPAAGAGRCRPGGAARGPQCCLDRAAGPGTQPARHGVQPGAAGP